MATINGDGGDNTLDGTAGADTINGLGGNDILGGLTGNDVLDGGDGDDVLNGGADNDTLDGRAGSNTLNGGDGADLIWSTFLDDVDGGAGDDVVHAGIAVGFTGVYDQLQGGLGTDTIFFEGAVLDSFSSANGFERVQGGVGRTLSGTAGDNILDFSGLQVIGGTTARGVHVFALGGDDDVHGTNGVDILYGGSGSNTLTGGDGNDLIHSEGDDSVLGGDGDDTVYLSTSGGSLQRTLDGGAGIDRVVFQNVTLEGFYSDAGFEVIEAGGINALVQGTDDINNFDFSDLTPLLGANGGGVNVSGLLGDDTILGTGGFDYIYGGGGADNLNGRDGADRIFGGNDDDNVRGDAGADTLSGEAGDDFLFGGDGADGLLGGDGIDTLSGGAGADYLKGEAGDDQLFGEGDDDNLNGGAGNDTIVGGAGVDSLTGGAGADIFIWMNGDLAADKAVTDRVTDYKASQGDVLDISRIDADTTVGGDQAFTFVASFTGVAGQAMLTVSGGVTTLVLDTNGDNSGDAFLLINGTVTAAANWIL